MFLVAAIFKHKFLVSIDLERRMSMPAGPSETWQARNSQEYPLHQRKQKHIDNMPEAG
jgi:hypothetical protein